MIEYIGMDSGVVVPLSGLLELVGTRVPRIGYGTMRLTGPGVFGPPADPAEARRVLRQALELGVRVFDTAWYYGPDIRSQLLAEATRSYPDDLVIATKLGWEYDDRGRLVSAHTPERLRAGMERATCVCSGPTRSRSSICGGAAIGRGASVFGAPWPP